MNRLTWILGMTLAVILPAWADSKTEPLNTSLPGTGADVGKTVIYRDTWGVPHIYAPTVEDGLYAQGYAQAEDRPQQLLMNFKIAMGEFTEVIGEEAVTTSMLSLLFDHYGTAQRAWETQSKIARLRIQSFVDGINAWYATHPDDVPQWWQHGQVTPAMADAFGRMFLNNWSIDEAIGDIKRGGVEPDFIMTSRGSNQFVVGPARSANGHAMLLIDPHLNWLGPSRFWEMRIHAGELEGSGVGLAGSPYIGLGHNANMAWAMTTGGPDTADVYELSLNADGSRYEYEDEWKPITNKSVTLHFPDGTARRMTMRFSHHGPILAQKKNKAYAARIPYDETADRNAAWVELNFARDYQGALKAGATLAMFPQNVMVADTAGNIHYQRVGRVPKRDAHYDWSKPVPGNTKATEWQGFHPADDLVQVLNPKAGYMQNCNIPPEAMIRGGAFKPEQYTSYVWGSAAYGRLHGWTNQRGARALELLSADTSVTVDEMLAYANDVRPFGIDRWLDALQSALPDDQAASALYAWDGQLLKESVPALRYAYWRMALEANPAGPALRARIDDHYAIVEDRSPRVVELVQSDMQLIVSTWKQAMQQMQADLGTLDAPWGRVFRVGRDDESWPVDGGGGDQFGLTTLRAMGYASPNLNHERWGQQGQTSTQVVVLSKPIQSFMYIPLGESDRKDSPHYNDQAKTVFSARTLKPTWWMPEDLQGHVESRTELARKSMGLVREPEAAPVREGSVESTSGFY